MRLFILLSLFFFVNSFAQEIIEVCPRNKTTSSDIKKTIDFLKTEQDKIDLSNGCFSILTTESRSILYRKFIAQKLDVTLKDFTSRSERSCRLKFDFEEDNSQDDKAVGNNHSTVFFGARKKNGIKLTSSSIQLIENTKGVLRFRDQSFNVLCKIKKSGYHLEIESLSELVNLKTSIILSANSRKFLGEFTSQKSETDNRVGITKNSLNQNNKTFDVKLFVTATN